MPEVADPWFEPIEDLASTPPVNKFVGLITVGLVGGFAMMILVLGTFNFQFYDWNLSTQTKTYIGFGAMLFGAGVFMLTGWHLIRYGGIQKQLEASGQPKIQQRLAFAVFYYQRWTFIRTWIIRLALLFATVVFWTDKWFGTQLQAGLDMTSFFFYAFFLYFFWAEWKFFTRIGSLPGVVTRSVSTPLIIGTIATGLGLVLIMPQIFGGLSIIDLRALGFSNSILAVLSALVLIASEWSDLTVRKLGQQAGLPDILAD